MPKFKVGDKVTIDKYPEEGIHTIESVDGHYYCYEFEEGGAWEDEGLTLVESAEPETKEPNYRIKCNGGGWLEVYVDHKNGKIVDHYGIHYTSRLSDLEKDPLWQVEPLTPKVKTQDRTSGGPSAYYDWQSGWTTLNDFIEYKSKHQWLEHSFHLGNIVKALTRWGDKAGTSIQYDAEKVIYSGCRVLMSIVGQEALRNYLQKLLDDTQFGEKRYE